MTPAIELHVLVTLYGDEQVGFTHLLQPYRGLHTISDICISGPSIVIHVYWSPAEPADRTPVLAGLEKYLNEILCGSPRYRRITRNYPVRLRMDLISRPSSDG